MTTQKSSLKKRPESPDAKKAKTRTIFRVLQRAHPEATIALKFSNPLELAIATILSAQCTDVKVNEVTRELFTRCKTIDDYLLLNQAALEKIIRPTGFFRQKAKNILSTVKMIKIKHKGLMPQTMEELVELPGIGRKTANVILGNAFGIPGLPVDTHVGRISKRLGITDKDDPVKIEFELNSLLKPKDWTQFSHTLIAHGRKICLARKPRCTICPVLRHCDHFAQVGME